MKIHIIGNKVIESMLGILSARVQGEEPKDTAGGGQFVCNFYLATILAGFTYC